MSITLGELENLTNARADFEEFISQRKWDDANALLDNLWDLGYKQEAIILQKALIAAKMNVNIRESNYLCVGKQGGCNGEHTTYCKDFNGGSAGQNEGEVTERSLRADETYD